MNEKISLKRVVGSPNLYFPELERYVGEDVEVTISISVDSQPTMRITYEDDEEPLSFIEEECAFEMT